MVVAGLIGEWMWWVGLVVHGPFGDLEIVDGVWSFEAVDLRSDEGVVVYGQMG